MFYQSVLIVYLILITVAIKPSASFHPLFQLTSNLASGPSTDRRSETFHGFEILLENGQPEFQAHSLEKSNLEKEESLSGLVRRSGDHRPVGPNFGIEVEDSRSSSPPTLPGQSFSINRSRELGNFGTPGSLWEALTSIGNPSSSPSSHHHHHQTHSNPSSPQSQPSSQTSPPLISTQPLGPVVSDYPSYHEPRSVASFQPHQSHSVLSGQFIPQQSLPLHQTLSPHPPLAASAPFYYVYQPMSPSYLRGQGYYQGYPIENSAWSEPVSVNQWQYPSMSVPSGPSYVNPWSPVSMISVPRRRVVRNRPKLIHLPVSLIPVPIKSETVFRETATRPLLTLETKSTENEGKSMRGMHQMEEMDLIASESNPQVTWLVIVDQGKSSQGILPVTSLQPAKLVSITR